MPASPIAPGFGLRKPRRARHRLFPTCRRGAAALPFAAGSFPGCSAGRWDRGPARILQSWEQPEEPGPGVAGRGRRRCRGGGTAAARAGGTAGRKWRGGRSSLWPRTHPSTPAGVEVGEREVCPAQVLPLPQKTLAQVPPLCQDPALAIPGLGRWRGGISQGRRGGSAPAWCAGCAASVSTHCPARGTPGTRGLSIPNGHRSWERDPTERLWRGLVKENP